MRIVEIQTKQWTKEKGQEDKHLSTKHTHTTEDRVRRTPVKTVVILVFSYYYFELLQV